MTNLTRKQKRMLAKVNRKLGKRMRKHLRLYTQEQAILHKLATPIEITVLDRDIND